MTQLETQLEGIFRDESWTYVWAGVCALLLGPLFARSTYRKSGDQSAPAKVMWLLFGIALASLGCSMLIVGLAGVWIVSVPPPSPLTPETITASLRPAEWALAVSKIAMALTVLGFLGAGVVWVLGKRSSRST